MLMCEIECPSINRGPLSHVDFRLRHHYSWMHVNFIVRLCEL